MTPNVMPYPRNVLILDADRAVRSLIAEWLTDEGWQVVDPTSADDGTRLSLIVLELSFPREGAPQPVDETKRRFPGVPILVLSPTVFTSVRCSGPCADMLGVAGVLPKPVARATLIDTVRRLALQAPR
jgi:CheY-like chemotaxis protein